LFHQVAGVAWLLHQVTLALRFPLFPATTLSLSPHAPCLDRADHLLSGAPCIRTGAVSVRVAQRL